MKIGYTLLLALALFLVPERLLAQTNVSGQISSNTTWTLAGSPYNVIGGVLIKEGITLTIEAGVTIKVASGLAIQIDGTLIARGTSSSMITFTKSATNSWGYILFSDKSIDAAYDIDGNYTGGSILEYCIIEYTGGTSVTNNGAVRMDAAHPLMNNCMILNNSASGICAFNLNSLLKISNCSILYNVTTNGNALRISGGVTIISNNTITNNSGGGAALNISDSYSTIYNNQITGNNGGGGISFSSKAGTTSKITYNTIENNITTGSGGGLSLDINGDLTVANNSISNNSSSSGGGIYIYAYWSNGNLSVMNNKITKNISTGGGGGINLYAWQGAVNLIISKNYIIDNLAVQEGAGISYNATSWGQRSISYNVISNNISTNGTGGAIYGTGYNLNNNILYKNQAKDKVAFYLNCNENTTIQFNSIIQNSSSSGTSITNASILGLPIFNFNNIFYNSGAFDLWNENAQSTANLNLKNNWWGTTNDQVIQSKIYDWFDDATKGIVSYQPYETAPRTDAPISPPSNVYISGTSLTWSANLESDIAGYRIYWDTDNIPPYTNFVDAGKVTSYNIQSIPPGAYIAITAFDSGYNAANEDPNTITDENQTNGNESWYAEAAQAPPSVPVLSFPANGATDMSTQPTFKWKKSTGAISYHLIVSSDTNFIAGNIYDQSVTDTLQKVTGLANNTKYFWKVNASNESSTSQFSATWSFKTALISASIGSVTGTSPLCAGATASFTANNVVLAGGTGSWSSSNIAVASVNSSGLVTAVSAGTCNIIYTITGGTGGTVSAEQALSVNQNSSILSVTGNDFICRWDYATFTANSVTLGTGTGSWSSSNTTIATIDANGEAYGKYSGNCEIIYTITGGCNGTVSAKKTITVGLNANVSSVSGQSSICIGGTATFTANDVTLSGGTGTWSSSNTAVATVNSSGVVTGVAAGTCTITYTITGGCGDTDFASATLTVSNASIGSVTGTSPVCIGSAVAFSANSVISGGGTGTWSSSNVAVAIVNSSGSVTGVTEGTCNIIYTITGGCGGTVSAQKSITVNQASSISSVVGAFSLCAGKTANYSATAVLGTGTGSWSSSNTAVATVNSSGLVTGVSTGTSYIYYTITGGCNGTISSAQTINILPSASIASVSGTSPLCAGTMATYTTNSLVLGGGTGAWASSNENIATVNSSGIVTAKTGGTCDIIYTITGNSCSGTIYARTAITVLPLPVINNISNGSSCGPGVVFLYASPTAGTVSWYPSQTSSTELGTGTLFTTPNLSLTTTYFVEAKSGNCISASRTPVIANIYEIPAPDISIKWGDVLVCSNTSNTFEFYQWINGTEPIPGATKQYYVTGKQPGTYKVEIIDKNGCRGTSAEIKLKSGTGNISLFPNPVKSEIQINFSNDLTGRVFIRFLNESGKIFKEATFEKTEQNFHNIIDVNNLLSGIYFVKISINGIPVADSKIVVVK